MEQINNPLSHFRPARIAALQISQNNRALAQEERDRQNKAKGLANQSLRSILAELGSALLSGHQSTLPRDSSAVDRGNGSWETRESPFPKSGSIVICHLEERASSSRKGLSFLCGKTALTDAQRAQLAIIDPHLAKLTHLIEQKNLRWMVSRVLFHSQSWDPCGRWDKETETYYALEVELPQGEVTGKLARALRSRAAARERHSLLTEAAHTCLEAQKQRKAFAMIVDLGQNDGFVFRNSPKGLEGKREKREAMRPLLNSLSLAEAVRQDIVFGPILKSFEKGGFRWELKGTELHLDLRAPLR